MKISIKTIVEIATAALGIYAALKGEWIGFVIALLSLISWVLGLIEEREKDEEIEKLKRHARPRTLSDSGSAQIASAVHEFSGQNICLFYPSDNEEAFNFTKEIARALKAGGLNVTIPRHLIIDGGEPISFDSREPSGPISIACADSRRELATKLSDTFMALELAPTIPVRPIDFSDEGEATHAREWPESLFLMIAQKDV